MTLMTVLLDIAALSGLVLVLTIVPALSARADAKITRQLREAERGTRPARARRPARTIGRARPSGTAKPRGGTGPRPHPGPARPAAARQPEPGVRCS